MRILVVDDEEYRHEFFKRAYASLDNVLIQCYSYESALLEISSTPNSFDLIFLDHDLGDSGSGYDLAKFIVREIDPKKSPDLEIFLHSMNPIGRANMFALLSNSGFNVLDAPFYGLSIRN